MKRGFIIQNINDYPMIYLKKIFMAKYEKTFQSVWSPFLYWDGFMTSWITFMSFVMHNMVVRLFPNEKEALAKCVIQDFPNYRLNKRNWANQILPTSSLITFIELSDLVEIIRSLNYYVSIFFISLFLLQISNWDCIQ